MKSFITALVLAVVIIAGSLFYSWHVNRISDYMVGENQKIIESIETEDYPEAARRADELETYVERHKSALAASIDHSNLDTIDIYMSQTKKYVQTGQKADALASCEVLGMLFARLPRDYELKWENIL